ncbi:GNAT family N-acetyltransferase [Actinoplanes sp. NPDC051494]|uniref:GNAT family N-acetyltransferase n=1 Tax=Actinoplanes sp. NPDC051494 TaxID=3363907 RepID=UPI0037AB52AA
MEATWALRPARLETDGPAVAALLAEYLDWAIATLQATYGVEDSPTDVSEISRSLPAYLPPAGYLVVAESGGELVGTGALRTLEPGVTEVKRMYVTPAFRSRRLGSAILDHLLDTAAGTLGAGVVRLDTCRFMTDAQRLYGSRGLLERDPYEGTEIPPHLQRYWRFFEKRL